VDVISPRDDIDETERSTMARPKFLSDSAINRLVAHTMLHQLAWGLSGVFISVFLLRSGVPAAGIFLAIAAIFALRFVSRGLVLLVIPAIGPRRTLILGTLLFALQYPTLALVHGVGPALLLFCAVTALGDVFYWTCYHAFYATAGDAERLGSQVGQRSLLGTAAGSIGPALGGIMLTAFGPWAAFGMAAAIEVAAILPLLKVTAPRFERIAPRGAYAAARRGILLFCTDGWIVCCSSFAWDMVAFHTLGARFDAFGGMLAAAAIAGAFGGAIFGRVIDTRHARRTGWFSIAVCAFCLVMKSVSGFNPVLVVGAATIANLLGGIYVTSLMAAVYNQAKAAPCPLRFQLAAEGGWDVGAASGCLVAAAACMLGVPLQAVILLALPGVAMQGYLLSGIYARGGRGRLVAAE
jgi:predicted MFS family arabinose efflux permease